MHTPPGLILASQSPRRRAMLAWLGIHFTVTDGEVNEMPLEGEPPDALAVRLAREKAAQNTTATLGPGWVLTADTVVDLDGQTLGKPADAAEARRMLEQLREGTHRVHTAIALAEAGRTPAVRCVTSTVRMRPYTDAEIAAYVATGNPADKAGAYAIQHPGFHPVADVRVCYANVVGLPLCAVVRLLKEVNDKWTHGQMTEGQNQDARIGEAGWEIDIDVPALCLHHFGYVCPGPDEGREIDK